MNIINCFWELDKFILPKCSWIISSCKRPMFYLNKCRYNFRIIMQRKIVFYDIFRHVYWLLIVCERRRLVNLDYIFESASVAWLCRCDIWVAIFYCSRGLKNRQGTCNIVYSFAPFNYSLMTFTLACVHICSYLQVEVTPYLNLPS